MQGPAHLVISWFTAESCGFEVARSRRIIALAGFSPDLDVLAYLAAYVYFGFDRGLAYEHVWATTHHHYTHGLGFAFLVGFLAWFCARLGPASRGGADTATMVGLFSFLAVLLHVFFDLIAAGARYPVYPFWPLSDLAWTVSWSWELRDWPNQVITLTCLGAILVYARLAGRSPLESIHYRADVWLVTITQRGSDSHHAASTEKIIGFNRATYFRLWLYLALAAICAIVIIPVANDLF